MCPRICAQEPPSKKKPIHAIRYIVSSCEFKKKIESFVSTSIYGWAHAFALAWPIVVFMQLRSNEIGPHLEIHIKKTNGYDVVSERKGTHVVRAAPVRDAPTLVNESDHPTSRSYLTGARGRVMATTSMQESTTVWEWAAVQWGEDVTSRSGMSGY